MKACACAVDWGVQVAMMVRCVLVRMERAWDKDT